MFSKDLFRKLESFHRTYKGVKNKMFIVSHRWVPAPFEMPGTLTDKETGHGEVEERTRG